jgi:hypothetical protein
MQTTLYNQLIAWCRNHKEIIIAVAIVILLALVPTIEAKLIIGNKWQGVPQDYF